MTPQQFVDALNHKYFPQLGYKLSADGKWWVMKWPGRYADKLPEVRYPAKGKT